MYDQSKSFFNLHITTIHDITPPITPDLAILLGSWSS